MTTKEYERQLAPASDGPPAVAEALKVLCSHSEWLRERGSAFEKEHSNAVHVLSDHIQAGAGPGGERARAIEECARIAANMADHISIRPHVKAFDALMQCAENVRALLPPPAPATETTQ